MTILVRTLTPHQARRYRRIHGWLWVSPIVAFVVGGLGARFADQDGTAGAVFGMVAIVGACVGLLAAALYQNWLLRYIAPETELKSKILSLGWIGPFGALWAVRELLDQSVLQGGEKPL